MSLLRTLGLAALAAGLASPLVALKYAAREHHLQADPSLPVWQPGPLTIHPEEEFNLVGADTMDEITLGWVKLFRQAYPELSVTMEARASGTGVPALTAGIADAAPVAREYLPKEKEDFVKRFGYAPFGIRVATGSLGSLGKTAATVFLVAKDNPIPGLTFAQIDAIYSKTRRRGHAPVNTWGDLGDTGDWASRRIDLYGLKPPNGIEQFVRYRVLDGGEWKDDIKAVKAVGFMHPFTVAAHEFGKDLGGIEYAMIANVTPEVRVVPIAEHDGGPFVMPTIQTVYTHKYPLSRYIYIYVNRPPGQPLAPKVKEFLKLVLSLQGQRVVAHEGVFMPLTPDVVREELAKLE